MLIYVLPFVLLLVIAIVLKKREANKEAEPKTQRTVAAKNKAKKNVAVKKSTAPAAVAEKTPSEPTTTLLATDLRNKIEGQIRERNFFSAEAQINQALNKDSSQHELYLLLLEIHILQKDDFAISQLLNHLRSLKLHDILVQAEAKHSEYEHSHVSPHNTIAVQPIETPRLTEQQVVTERSAPLEFDTLISTNTPTDAPVDSRPVLDFDISSFNTTPITPTENKLETPTLEFDLSDTRPASSEVQPSVEEVKPLDFSTLSFEIPAPAAVTITEDIKPLDFSLSLEPAVNFVPPTEAIATPVTAHADLNFDLSKEWQTEATPALDLTLTEPSVVQPAPVMDLNFNLADSSLIEPVTSSDPLVQSFPHLLETNDIRLNLQLAEQYIQLGAFEAARQILLEQAPHYDAEQQQQAEKLRHRMAS